jgi:hypothetical protein
MGQAFWSDPEFKKLVVAFTGTLVFFTDEPEMRIPWRSGHRCSGRR